MADIFISYKREDQEEHGRVKPIADALRAEGYEVFYDVHVPPGSKWEDVLEAKIAMARAVLVLWSSASVESDWVKEEAEMAKAAGKLIPVLLDPVTPPFGFARIESANLAGWTGDLAHIEWKNLVAAVKARIGDGQSRVQPGVTSVGYPRSPAGAGAAAKGRGKARGGLVGLAAGFVVLAVAAIGLLAVQLMDTGRTGPTETVVEAAVEQAPPAADAEKEAEQSFANARRVNTAAAYEAFARQYPDSRLADAALQRAETLRKRAAEREAAERAREAAAAGSYDDISERSYRIAGVTLSDIQLSPAPPARIVPGENISISFSYRLDAAQTAHVWARPVHSGTGACSYGASGSPELTGAGRGSQRFAMNGNGCQNHEITGIRFSVQPDDDRDRADQVIVPVKYTFR